MWSNFCIFQLILPLPCWYIIVKSIVKTLYTNFPRRNKLRLNELEYTIVFLLLIVLLAIKQDEYCRQIYKIIRIFALNFSLYYGRRSKDYLFHE